MKAMDVKTRKLLTMSGAFHKRGSVLRLYLKRKDGGRGLIGVEDCVRTEEAGLAEYVRQSSEWMLNAVNDMGIVSSVETADEYRKRVDAERKENLAGKALHGKFFREVSEVAAQGGIDIDMVGAVVERRVLDKNY